MFILALLPSPAFACGGMFCDAITPVDQAAERIVFAWSPDQDGSGQGTITTEVQIAFQGEADDFAWVVPVPSVPELFTSNDAIFSVLANGSIPTFALANEEFGECELTSRSYQMSDAGSTAAPESGNGVSVVASETVGPYETVILQANDSAQLLDWLNLQGYTIPTNIEPVVRPYVAASQYFVALKLAADRDTGDLAPLGMTYRGTAASIPIQLTSIAAVPDLPIQAFIFGPSRAVPDNYLHVRINEASIDWYGGGLNYRDVVKRAADEAGGQAFATDFSGSPEIFAGMLWNDGMLDLDTLRNESDPLRWLESIVFSGLPSSSQLTALLLTYVPPPDGVDGATFLQCPGCYTVEMDDFDPDVATDALEAEIIDVLRDGQAIVDGADHMTRLFTTMDATEMTVDPVFVFNDDVEQDLGFSWTAINEIHCGIYEGDGAERTLVLPDGREIDLPSEDWFAANETTEFEYMEELTSPAAIVIEDLGAEGTGTILFDFREEAAEAAGKFGHGCGCASTSGQASVPALLLMAGLLFRRR